MEIFRLSGEDVRGFFQSDWRFLWQDREGHSKMDVPCIFALLVLIFVPWLIALAVLLLLMTGDIVIIKKRTGAP